MKSGDAVVAPRAVAAIEAGSPVDRLTRLIGPAGCTRKPIWTTLLQDRDVNWVERHWNASSRVFAWDADDNLRAGVSAFTPCDLSQLPDRLTLEILAALALDARDGLTVASYQVRGIVRLAQQSRAETLTELPPNLLKRHSRLRLEDWTQRFGIAGADPEKEWDRDEVRLAVVRHGYSGLSTLRMDRIVQPWLRDVVVEYSQIRIQSLSLNSLQQRVLNMGRLSQFLATRSDKGLQPDTLTKRAMDAFARSLSAGATSDALPGNVLKDVRAVLVEVRALGLVDKYGLPGSFSVRPEHIPATAKTIHVDRALPDATFRLLLGADDHLGARVLDLARSVPHTALSGETFVAAMHLAANFGRRPAEMSGLMADRVRTEDSGSAALLYDNFKAGREAVWLPIDARSALHITSWIGQLRESYPKAPLEKLALLPSPYQNPSGASAMNAKGIADWFRVFVELLEQAIVLAHLNAATGLPIADLCRLLADDVDDDSLRVDGEHVSLQGPARMMLTEYLHDLRNRHDPVKHRQAPPSDQLPLFPCPHSRQGKKSARVPVSPKRFDALGPAWAALAATYASPGIPGNNLGASRISPDALQIRLFRHTYLQHLVDAGVSIFIVAELADHANVQTTIDSYVRVKEERLREAVEMLNDYHIDLLGRRRKRQLPLINQSGRDVITNSCSHPEVLALGTEGCDNGRCCYRCRHYSADPSNVDDIKAEIQTCVRSINLLEHGPDDDMKPHRLAVLKEQWTGWQKMLDNLNALLAQLESPERERVELAAAVVRQFRNQARGGGINLGGSAGAAMLGMPS